MFACRKRPLQARHRRRLRTDGFSHLRLGQACVMPGFQQEVEQIAFFAFNALNFFANARATHQLGNQLFMSLHA